MHKRFLYKHKKKGGTICKRLYRPFSLFKEKYSILRAAAIVGRYAVACLFGVIRWERPVLLVDLFVFLSPSKNIYRFRKYHIQI